MYLNNHEFHVWCRRFGALALIPLEKLEEAWNIILETIPCRITKELLKFIRYFVKTWLKCEHYLFNIFRVLNCLIFIFSCVLK